MHLTESENLNEINIHNFMPNKGKCTLSDTIRIALTGRMTALHYEQPFASIKKKQVFCNVPIRCSDILHDRWLPTALLSQYAFNIDDGVIWTMMLAEQLSPPRMLMMGAYQWSLLRFLVCSLNRNVASYSFQVSVPDMDVGREGPFSFVTINCTKTIAACLSSRHTYCIFFPIPDLSSTNESILASTVRLPDSVMMAKWHPALETLLVILTLTEIIFLHTSASRSSLLSLTVIDVVDFSFLPIASFTEDVSYSFLSLLALKRNGSIEFIVANLKQVDESSVSLLWKPPSQGESTHMKNFNQQESEPILNDTVYPHVSCISHTSSLPSSSRLISQRVVLVEAETSSQNFTCLFILSYGLIFVLGRLAESGKMDILGVDISFENLQRRLTLGKSLKDFSSFCLDTFTIPLHASVASLIHVGPLATEKSVGTSALCCPYVTIVTPQDIVLVEFPWLTQIETFLVDLGCHPFLLPTHWEFLVSFSNNNNGADQDLKLNLGMFLVGNCGIELAPRYIVLQASAKSCTYNTSLWREDTEWKVCENWEVVSVSLIKKLTTNQMISDFQSIIREAWDILTPQPDLNSLKNNRLHETQPLYHKVLTAFKEVVDNTLSANAHPPKLSMLKQVASGETVQDILAKLGAASLKLWRIRSLRTQVKRLHNQITNMDLPFYVKQVAQTNARLAEKAHQTYDRIHTLREANKNLIHKFQYLLKHCITPLTNSHQLSLIMERILPLVRRACIPAALLFTDFISKDLDNILTSVTDYFVITGALRTNDSHIYGLKNNLLRQRVKNMVVDLGIVCHIFLALVSQAEWMLNKKITKSQSTLCIQSSNS